MDASAQAWPLALSLPLFAAGALAIGLAGPRLAGIAETLARRTGLGQALGGALFLGAVTSLSGITTSVAAALDGHAELALANALGGIAVQTAFLAIADLSYRAANLEHAAASPTNIFQGVLLTALLAVLLIAMSGPETTLLGVHPATWALFAGYAFGLRIAMRMHEEPMWRARRTAVTQTEADEGGARDRRSTRRLWLLFAAFAAAVAAAGWILARAGVGIAVATGLSETVVGGLFTAVATSLPELVTALAAVRRGALNLAVGDIIGGNVFDTLFAAVADIAYRPGSLYHAAGPRPMFLVALTVLLTSVLVLGMVRREPSGFANIGFESSLALALYAGGFAILWFW